MLPEVKMQLNYTGKSFRFFFFFYFLFSIPDSKCFQNMKGKHIFNPFQNFVFFYFLFSVPDSQRFQNAKGKNIFNLKCYTSQSYQLNESQIKDFPVMEELRTISSSCQLFSGNYMTEHFSQTEY